MGGRFRFAGAADVPAVVALVQAAYRGEVSRSGWTTEADLLDGQRVDAAMLAEALERPDVAVLVREGDGELVACCELRRPAPGGWASLGMFAVHPSAQGAGLGRQVLGEAERLAGPTWGATGVRLTVIEQRHELIAWYERRGYRRTGGHEPFPYGDERYGRPRRPDLRFVVMEKDLAVAAP